MDIQELIDMGNNAANSSKCPGVYNNGHYYLSERYAEWLSLATRFLENTFPDDKDTIRFRELSTRANGSGDECFQPLISILKAFDKFPPKPMIKDIFIILEDIFINFNKFDIAIKRRYANRSTIIIDDEHDLQNALYAILKLFVSNIIPEDYVPSYAGSNSRVDFLLPEHRLVIETKMTNANLKDGKIGEELIIDFNRYKELKKADCVICFIYDKDSNINNPAALINDLERLSDNEMQMRVFVSPQ